MYVREVLGVANPSVGLLNIGEESTKGGDFVKDTHNLMEERVTNFTGNVEANEVFTGRVDCIICDGFVGNVVIKVSEGLMESAGALLRREIKKSPLALAGGFFDEIPLAAYQKAGGLYRIRRGAAFGRQRYRHDQPRPVVAQGHQERHPRHYPRSGPQHHRGDGE